MSSEPRSLGHIDDCQVIEDAVFIAALAADALSFMEQANLLGIPDGGKPNRPNRGQSTYLDWRSCLKRMKMGVGFPDSVKIC